MKLRTSPDKIDVMSGHTVVDQVLQSLHTAQQVSPRTAHLPQSFRYDANGTWPALIPVMQTKIAALRKCITRVVKVDPYVTVGGYRPLFADDLYVRRFIALWQARNRRTRVLMGRQRESAQ